MVVFVMGRCYLKATRTEFHIHIGILDNRDFAVADRNQHVLPLQVLETLIIWVNAYSRIAQYCFGPGGGDHHGFIGTFNRIAQVV